ESGHDGIDCRSRSMSDLSEQHPVIGRREVRCESRHRMKVDIADCEHFQNDRIATGNPGGADTGVRGALAEMDDPRAPDKQRWSAISEVRLSHIQLGQMREEFDQPGPVPSHERLDVRQKFFVRELQWLIGFESHAMSMTRAVAFSASTNCDC
ncbi:MAG TPA: hypothetical protein VF720_14105, partial [Candidatus Eisenbacteria bacterium]